MLHTWLYLRRTTLAPAGAAIEVPVVFTATVPTVVVAELTAVAFPVALKVTLSIMMRCHPARAAVG